MCFQVRIHTSAAQLIQTPSKAAAMVVLSRFSVQESMLNGLLLDASAVF